MVSARPFPKTLPNGFPGGTKGSSGLKCQWKSETTQSQTTGISTTASKTTEVLVLEDDVVFPLAPSSAAFLEC